MKWVVVAMLLALAGLLGLAFTQFGAPNDIALQECKDAVLARLKSPGSAQFDPMMKAEPVEASTMKTKVVSWVDSQNGFGALLRTQFECEVMVLTSTSSAVVTDLKLD